MSNQNESPTAEGSAGSTTPKPVEALWLAFIKDHDLTGLHPDLLVFAKNSFYAGTVASYNLILASMRQDYTLGTTVRVSEAMRLDFESYAMSDSPKPSSH